MKSQQKSHVRRAIRRSSGGDTSSGSAPVRGASPARVAEVRRQIAAGTYLTEDKFAAAIEGLYADLLAEMCPARAVAG